jgi:diguanylate cyclase (GGDEF)-like protein
MGGEEFCILLPATPIKEAAEIAERVRRNIEHLHFDIDSNTFSITASFGVTLAEGGDETPEDIMKRADIKLYEAKSAGRNQVVM